jgi:hypothetical protein
MIELISVHWPSILIMLMVASLLIYMWVNDKKDLVKRVIYALVCQAEQQFGAGTGSAKLALVWTNLYARLPWIVRVLFPKKVLDKYIEDAVQLLKRELKDPKFNLMTYAQEVEEVITKRIN